MAWAEAKSKKQDIAIVEMHRPKELVYIMAKTFGFQCPPMLVTLRNKKTGEVRREALPI